MLDRITFNNTIMGGQACIRNLRVPVVIVLKLVASGTPISQILKDYPDLEEEDIHQSLQYAARLTEDQTIEIALR
ncbi:MAG: DUF433 domain-containing protein [Elusimicrobia bacterium]|nr:DUF433 domain-containing protein [Elusimicrobiota bacterium]